MLVKSLVCKLVLSKKYKVALIVWKFEHPPWYTKVVGKNCMLLCGTNHWSLLSTLVISWSTFRSLSNTRTYICNHHAYSKFGPIPVEFIPRSRTRTVKGFILVLSCFVFIIVIGIFFSLDRHMTLSVLVCFLSAVRYEITACGEHVSTHAWDGEESSWNLFPFFLVAFCTLSGAFSLLLSGVRVAKIE